jgi:glutamyl-tRNA synthetase
VNPNPARFDQKKADAINASHIRLLSPEDFEGRILPYLQSAGVLPHQPSAEQLGLLGKLAPLVQERITVLSEVSGMLGFMFQDDASLTYEQDALDQLPENSSVIISAAIEALLGLEDFTTAAIQECLSQALVEGLGEKPRNAFGPVRTAFSGRRVTPPLFECMEFLGKERTVSRLEAFARAH